MHDKLLLIVALLIPLVLGAGAFWTLAGSADPIRVPSAAPAVSLALTRPASGVQAPPTLAPRSSTATPTTVVSAPSPTPTGIVAQAPAQPTVAPKPTTSARADAARSTDRGKPKGKRRD